jgi:hypothetical protein
MSSQLPNFNGLLALPFMREEIGRFDLVVGCRASDTLKDTYGTNTVVRPLSTWCVDLLFFLVSEEVVRSSNAPLSSD